MNPSPRLSRKINVEYAAIQGAFISSVSVFYGFATILLQSKNFTSSEIGLAMALGAAASILLPSLVAGYSSRHPGIPLKYIITVLILATICSTALTMVVSSPVGLAMMIFVVVIAISTTVMPLLNALAMQFENIGITMNYGVARGIGSIGYAVFGYLAGLMAENIGTVALAPFYMLLLTVTIFLLLMFKRPDKVCASQEIDKTAETASVRGVHTLLKKPACIPFFIAMVCIALNHSALDTFQVSVIKDVGGSDADYGVLMFVMSISEIPTMFLFKYLARRFSYASLMSMGILSFVAKDVVLMLAPSVPMVIGAQVLNMFTLGLYVPAAVYFGNSVAGQDEAVQAQALFGGMAMGIGRILGNIGSGVIIDLMGIKPMLLFSAACVLVGFFMMQLAGSRQKRTGLSSCPSSGG